MVRSSSEAPTDRTMSKGWLDVLAEGPIELERLSKLGEESSE